MNDDDLLVIGTVPGGQKAAIAGAKLGRKVAALDAGNKLRAVQRLRG